jgi:hypothetical protein
MARLSVQVGGVDASVLVFRLVGGTQAPVTEVALAVTEEPGTEPVAALGRPFLDALMSALEHELRPANARRTTGTTAA